MRALVLFVAACSSKSDAPPAKNDVPARPEPAAPVADAAAMDEKPKPTTVRWSDVKRTTGCFFFSGPTGRDDQVVGDVVVETVEREGASLKLRIGTATFEGTYEKGELSLARKGKYEYEGAWATTETIRGRLVDGVIDAAYAYEECKIGTRECPGPCTVRGTLTFARGL